MPFRVAISWRQESNDRQLRLVGDKDDRKITIWIDLYGSNMMDGADYLAALRGRKFNHMYVGLTQEFEPYGQRHLVSQS